MRHPALAGDDHGIADPARGGAAELQRRRAEPAERLDEAEPGRLIVADHVGGRRGAGERGHPERLRLGDQIADRQDQPALSITTPLPARSVPKIEAVNASLGISARTATTDASARSRSNAHSSGRGCAVSGIAHSVSSLNRSSSPGRTTGGASGGTRSGPVGRSPLLPRRSPAKVAATASARKT